MKFCHLYQSKVATLASKLTSSFSIPVHWDQCNKISITVQKYQYKISNVLWTFSGSGTWLIFTVFKYCANIWDYSNSHQVQWFLWAVSSLRRNKKCWEHRWEHQDEQQQKIKLRKQMARYLQQDEKIQPLDFYNWLHIC